MAQAHGGTKNGRSAALLFSGSKLVNNSATQRRKSKMNLSMNKGSDKHSGNDSEIGSIRSGRISKLSAILCPTICALLIVCVFAMSFVGAKLGYEQYDAYCAGRFDVAKLYTFSNMTRMNHSSNADNLDKI
ncbi:putative Amastin [Operophtera brumata]|uniref:Putative Amastin n=1 Tax=Operophtera brumata TaxID=104452 RepID=A0A0L7KLV4_OPEBR|nr:putative Amastin [Operophtera brumata]